MWLLLDPRDNNKHKVCRRDYMAPLHCLLYILVAFLYYCTFLGPLTSHLPPPKTYYCDIGYQRMRLSQSSSLSMLHSFPHSGVAAHQWKPHDLFRDLSTNVVFNSSIVHDSTSTARIQYRTNNLRTRLSLLPLQQFDNYDLRKPQHGPRAVGPA